MRRIALAAAAALAGCTVGPDFVAPKPAVPAAWGATAAGVASRPAEGAATDAAWWRAFGDPELTALVDRLAAQNLDLAAAAERIDQARGQRRIAAAQGLPRLSGTGSYTRTRPSENGFISLVQPAPDAPAEYSQFTAGGQASWEIDLFGRIRRQVESANATVQASIEERHDIALSAVAELASTYMQLRQAQAQEAILRRNVAASRRRSTLVRDRFREGAASMLEVAQADAQVSQIEQDLPSIVAREARLSNAIALLLAVPPRTLDAELAARPGVQPAVPPTVPVGLPSDLARRRPDIRQAEAELHAATADTGVAVAAFYPSVSIGAAAGFDSLHGGSLFDWASRMYMVTPRISLPIFQGGQLRGNLELRRARQREAAIAYRRAVLAALHDVDNAMVGYAQAQRSRADADTLVRADTVALAAAQDRYAEGAVDFLDVVSAQTALYAGQNALASADAAVETALVQLFRALGGGWDVAPEPGPASARRR